VPTPEQLKKQLDRKSAELVRTVLTNRGFTFLDGEQLEDGSSFEHVACLDLIEESKTVFIITSRVKITNFGCQLEFDDGGRMQFSKEWIDENLRLLPDYSNAKQAIQQADNLIALVAGVDTATDEFQIIKVDTAGI